MIDFLLGEVSHQYDLRNLFDLARHLLLTQPVQAPVRLHRKMLVLGSGDPT